MTNRPLPYVSNCTTSNSSSHSMKHLQTRKHYRRLASACDRYNHDYQLMKVIGKSCSSVQHVKVTAQRQYTATGKDDCIHLVPRILFVTLLDKHARNPALTTRYHKREQLDGKVPQKQFDNFVTNSTV